MEFRLDSLRSPTFEEINAKLSAFSERSMLTVRPAAEGGGFRGRESERITLIRSLAELKPAFLDIELRTLEKNPELALERPRRTMIASWHDQTKTPGGTRLRSIAHRAAVFGTPKVVTTAKTTTDNLTIISLYEGSDSPPIAFCMGPLGVFSRVMAMEKGSPITYASLPGEPTAPGQFTLSQALAIRRHLENA